MIYFVRHGQTINNVNKVFYDESAGPGLTEKGVAQAESTAEQLKDVKFDICYCSPKKRAVETMKIVTQSHPDLKVVYDERLSERSYGELMGQPQSVCEAGNRWMRYQKFPYKGVESVDDVYDRLKSFYDEIDDKGKNVLVVAHSGIHRVSYCYFHGFPADNDLSKIKLENGKYEIFQR